MRDDVQNDAEEVADASGQDKEVPDRVCKWQLFPGIEDHADAVGESTCSQPRKPRQGNMRYKRFGGKDDEPPHQEINRDRDHAKTLCKEALANDSYQAQSPNQAEESPAPVTTEIDQHEWRVGAGN